jgi:hypothetical protein
MSPSRPAVFRRLAVARREEDAIPADGMATGPTQILPGLT